MTERFQAMRVLEALRSGVPSPQGVTMLPTLRPGTLDVVKSDLQALVQGQHTRGRIVWGDYGQGKSHLLHELRNYALQKNCAVSLLPLGREMSAQNLMHLYTRAAAVMTAPGSTLGIRKQLESLSPESLVLPASKRYSHPLPAIVLELYLKLMGQEGEADLLGDLMGVRMPLPAIRQLYRSAYGRPFPKLSTPFRQSENATAYWGVMADLIRQSGYSGWVVLIDEAELIGRLGVKGRAQAYRNLAWLMNLPGEHTFPIYTVVAFANSLRADRWTPGLALGQRGRRKIPDPELIPSQAWEYWGEATQRKLATFFTLAQGPERSLNLAPPGISSVLALLVAIQELHSKAYGSSSQLNLTSMLASLGDVPTRTYVRAVIEAMDYALTYGTVPRFEAVTLTQYATEEDDEYFVRVSDE